MQTVAGVGPEREMVAGPHWARDRVVRGGGCQRNVSIHVDRKGANSNGSGQDEPEKRGARQWHQGKCALRQVQRTMDATSLPAHHFTRTLIHSWPGKLLISSNWNSLLGIPRGAQAKQNIGQHETGSAGRGCNLIKKKGPKPLSQALSSWGLMRAVSTPQVQDGLRQIRWPS